MKKSTTTCDGLGYSMVGGVIGELDFARGIDLSSLSSIVVLGSSAMYLKDSDPKLLDKAPFWHGAYDWIKRKVSFEESEPVGVVGESSKVGYD